MTEQNINMGAISVLIVDDQDLIRKSITKVLKKMRFANLFDCASGEDAKKIFDKNHIELVISDLYMGKFDGFRLLEYIRSRDTRSDVPFIVITGEASKEDIVKTVDLGADDYILKPFQPEDLEKKIAKVLSNYLNPTPLLAVLRNAELLFAQLKLNDAMALVDSTLKKEPASSRALYLKSLIYARASHFDLAIQTLNKNIKINPSFYKNYAALANIYLKTNNPGEALKAMEEELSVNPKQPLRQTELAKLYLSQGNPEEAINRFRLALRDDGRLQKALYGMGMAYAATNNVEKAIYYFKRLRRNHPTVSKALEAIVTVAIEGKVPRQAEVALREERRAFPQRLDTYIILARFLLTLERPQDAIVILAELIKKDPGNIEAMRLKGMTHIQLNQYDDGIHSFRQILKLNQDSLTCLHLGNALVKKGDFTQAIEVLHLALKLKANAVQVLFRLGEAYLNTSQFLKAYSTFQSLKLMGVSDPALAVATKNSLEQGLERRRQRIAAA